MGYTGSKYRVNCTIFEPMFSPLVYFCQKWLQNWTKLIRLVSLQERSTGMLLCWFPQSLVCTVHISWITVDPQSKWPEGRRPTDARQTTENERWNFLWCQIFHIRGPDRKLMDLNEISQQLDRFIFCVMYDLLKAYQGALVVIVATRLSHWNIFFS